MYPSARKLTFVQRVRENLYHLLLTTVVTATLIILTSTQTFAQTITPPANASMQYFQTRTDEQVPQNLSTFSQSVMIEVMAGIVCQLVGIDPINPKQPCLGVNPETNKLGYVSQNSEELQVGGLLGMTPQLFGVLYTPTTSTTEYVRTIGQGFGIVKTAYAANGNDGFESLKPILGLWAAVRNVAYMFLILAFIFIGLGIMLRVKIDPRTVMTIQNQIPRIIICILLITFSYAIAALMIDGMWLTTYAGINIITSAGVNPQVGLEGKNYPLSDLSTKSILQTPLAYINAVQATEHNAYLHITDAVSRGVSAYFGDVAKHVFNTGDDELRCGINIPTPVTIVAPITGVIDNDQGSLKECIANSVGFAVRWGMRYVTALIIFTTLLVVLFRIWFMLLKAYVWVLLYVIGAPIWIVFGLLPGRPLGFEKWIRSLFTNLIIFPVAAFLFVGGRVIAELFKENPGNKFVAPLTGNPNMPDFGILIAFGMLLMGPKMLTMIQESMKAQGTKHGAAIAAGLAAGAAAPAAFANNRWQAWTRRNPHTNEAIGFVARLQQTSGEKILKGATKIPLAGGLAKQALADKIWARTHGQSFMQGGKESTRKQRREFAKDYMNQQQADKQAPSWLERRRANKEAKHGQGKNTPPPPETPPTTPPTTPPVSPKGGPKPTQGGGGGAHATPPAEHQNEAPYQGRHRVEEPDAEHTHRETKPGESAATQPHEQTTLNVQELHAGTLSVGDQEPEHQPEIFGLPTHDRGAVSTVLERIQDKGFDALKEPFKAGDYKTIAQNEELKTKLLEAIERAKREHPHKEPKGPEEHK